MMMTRCGVQVFGKNVHKNYMVYFSLEIGFGGVSDNFVFQYGFGVYVFFCWDSQSWLQAT